ncbi:protein phosphatase 2C domain-containing protein [Nocardiopsis halophila]|uniref:protein phosphatase 2C domain-containing protein n=1 Tax=Nocardiopsis halophila TaxID=141692 RepID=UPI00034749BD|nr:protein phosphatase 2C domain-containing protein [Nocardiopsis halophila]
MSMTLLNVAGAAGGPGDDFAAAGEGSWAVAIDGATARPGVETGCIHDPAWYARTLGAHLGFLLTLDEEAPLADLLEEAIARTCREHGHTCDLTNPDSPSAAVAIARRSGGRLDALALADSPVVVQTRDELRVVKDDRNDFLGDYSNEGVARARNVPGGFWVASTAPQAAHEALTASTVWADVERVAVLTDGAARLVERFGIWEWGELVQRLADEGPAAVIARTRRAEEAETDEDRARFKRRGKQHDDATAILWAPGAQP